MIMLLKFLTIGWWFFLGGSCLADGPTFVEQQEKSEEDSTGSLPPSAGEAPITILRLETTWMGP